MKFLNKEALWTVGNIAAIGIGVVVTLSSSFAFGWVSYFVLALLVDIRLELNTLNEK